MKHIVFFYLIAIVGIFAACSGKMPSNLGEKGGKLPPCPPSPNCVSSQSTDADKEHYIKPLSYSGSLADAKAKLVNVIQSMKRSKIITQSDAYIHAEYTSAMFRFVDDVEFCFDDAKKIIHVRSASRMGYGDFGVNRKRVEEIRNLFEEK